MLQHGEYCKGHVEQHHGSILSITEKQRWGIVDVDIERVSLDQEFKTSRSHIHLKVKRALWMVQSSQIKLGKLERLGSMRPPSSCR